MKNKVKGETMVKGGLQHERDMTRLVVSWCINHFNLDVHKTDINVLLRTYTDCYGTCVDNDDGGYDIEISFNQPLLGVALGVFTVAIGIAMYVGKK